jgi:hypothetical protein
MPFARRGVGTVMPTIKQPMSIHSISMEVAQARRQGATPYRELEEGAHVGIRPHGVSRLSHRS